MWFAFLAVLCLACAAIRADPDTAFSIYVNVTGWSPMMFYVDSWQMDRETGALSTANATWTGGIAFLWIVGSRFLPYGTVRDLAPQLNQAPGKISYLWGGSSDAELLKPYPDVDVLAEPSRIQLGPYYIYVQPEVNTTLTIDYVTIEIPIATEAPSEEALRATASTSRAVESNYLNGTSFTVRQFDSQRYAKHFTGGDDRIDPVPPALYDIKNGTVVLGHLTELVYEVPANTSLINITGPVYDADSSCYAYLDPEPWWWNGGVVPSADPSKPLYRPEQTLLILPTDPAVEYRLIVGSGAAECAVSSVVTYSYFKPKPAASSSAPSSASSMASPDDAPKPSDKSSKSPSAGVIAGAAIGSAFGVALLALAIVGGCYLHRRRKRATGTPRPPPSIESAFEQTEDVQVIVPFAPPPLRPPRPSSVERHSKHETANLLSPQDSESVPYMSAAAEKRNAQLAMGQNSFPSDPSGSMSRLSAVTPAQRAEDMEDAQEAQLLPPEYNEAWGQRRAGNIDDAAASSRLDKSGAGAEGGAMP